MSTDNNPTTEAPEAPETPEAAVEATSDAAAEATPKSQPLTRSARVSIFFGIVLLLIATYLFIVCGSYLSTVSSDQSLVENRGLAALTQTAAQIKNYGGPLGAFLGRTLISKWMGIASFIMIFYIAAISVNLLRRRHFKFWTLTLKCLLSTVTLSMVLGLITLHSQLAFYWGGYHGHYINQYLHQLAGYTGPIVVCVILVSLTVLLFYHDLHKWYMRARRTVEKRRAIQMEQYRQSESRRREEVVRERQAERERRAAKRQASEPEQEPEVVEQPATEVADEEPSRPATRRAPRTKENPEMTVNAAAPIEEATEIKTDVYDPTAELSKYRFPSLDLLQKPRKVDSSVDKKEQEENKERITKMLLDYGIEISRIEATVGATITLYEIVPAEGVRISQIKRLEDDIALVLSAMGIRIIAPIPGRGTIGLEVPNKDPQVVSIRSILSSKRYCECKMELPMAVGTTIQNEVFIADLAKMPHLLVAGATGMGKSVGLNTIIASLLYKKHPAELKLVLIDPKMVEFSLYSKLERHYLAKLPGDDDAVITDPKKVVTTLNSLCVEMDNRYRLLKQSGDRGIKDYNRRFVERRLNPEKGHRYLPYIVVIVDEFADLIMTAGKEVETPIARLAQKARAVGIHLILATQRPSTNVITGLIKANFPGRVAFRVTQMVDSRTILDRPGANQLIGRGDMLFSRDGEITRVQCAFIDTPEVEAICDAIDSQIGYEHAYMLPEYVPDAEGGEGGGGGNNFGDRDSLFDEAARLIVTSGLASTSSLQRRYSIGYNRAGKIMDQLEAAGIVGPSQGGKPRQVLVNDMATLESIISQ